MLLYEFVAVVLQNESEPMKIDTKFFGKDAFRSFWIIRRDKRNKVETAMGNNFKMCIRDRSMSVYGPPSAGKSSRSPRPGCG